MHRTIVLRSTGAAATCLAIALSVALVACGGSTTSPSQTAPVAQAAASVDTAHAADLRAREQALALREAALAAQEQERLQQEAAEAQRQQEIVAKNAAAKKAALAKSTAAKRSPVVASNPAPAKASVAPAPVVAPPIEVPADTPIIVALATDLSSKSAMRGDVFDAHLVSDLIIDNRRVAPVGARVTGTIVDVVSGSKAIGATPMLSLAFDHLELDGQRIAIHGAFVQRGKSEKARDTAKILGGAAAGAVVGHQVKNNDTGTIIGGLLGGAAGTIAAKKTGTEVQLAAGSTVTITLSEAFKVARTS